MTAALSPSATSASQQPGGPMFQRLHHDDDDTDEIVVTQPQSTAASVATRTRSGGSSPSSAAARRSAAEAARSWGPTSSSDGGTRSRRLTPPRLRLGHLAGGGHQQPPPQQTANNNSNTNSPGAVAPTSATSATTASGPRFVGGGSSDGGKASLPPPPGSGRGLLPHHHLPGGTPQGGSAPTLVLDDDVSLVASPYDARVVSMGSPLQLSTVAAHHLQFLPAASAAHFHHQSHHHYHHRQPSSVARTPRDPSDGSGALETTCMPGRDCSVSDFGGTPRYPLASARGGAAGGMGSGGSLNTNAAVFVSSPAPSEAASPPVHSLWSKWGALSNSGGRGGGYGGAPLPPALDADNFSPPRSVRGPDSSLTARSPNAFGLQSTASLQQQNSNPNYGLAGSRSRMSLMGAAGAAGGLSVSFQPPASCDDRPDPTAFDYFAPLISPSAGAGRRDGGGGPRSSQQKAMTTDVPANSNSAALMAMLTPSAGLGDGGTSPVTFEALSLAQPPEYSVASLQPSVRHGTGLPQQQQQQEKRHQPLHRGWTAADEARFESDPQLIPFLGPIRDGTVRPPLPPGVSGLPSVCAVVPGVLYLASARQVFEDVWNVVERETEEQQQLQLQQQQQLQAADDDSEVLLPGATRLPVDDDDELVGELPPASVQPTTTGGGEAVRRSCASTTTQSTASTPPPMMYRSDVSPPLAATESAQQQQQQHDEEQHAVAVVSASSSNNNNSSSSAAAAHQTVVELTTSDDSHYIAGRAATIERDDDDGATTTSAMAGRDELRSNSVDEHDDGTSALPPPPITAVSAAASAAMGPSKQQQQQGTTVSNAVAAGGDGSAVVNSNSNSKRSRFLDNVAFLCVAREQRPPFPFPVEQAEARSDPDGRCGTSTTSSRNNNNNSSSASSKGSPPPAPTATATTALTASHSTATAPHSCGGEVSASTSDSPLPQVVGDAARQPHAPAAAAAATGTGGASSSSTLLLTSGDHIHMHPRGLRRLSIDSNLAEAAGGRLSAASTATPTTVCTPQHPPHSNSHMFGTSTDVLPPPRVAVTDEENTSPADHGCTLRLPAEAQPMSAAPLSEGNGEAPIPASAAAFAFSASTVAGGDARSPDGGNATATSSTDSTPQIAADHAKHIPMADDARTRLLDVLPEAFEYILKHAAAGRPVLMYCRKGKSRSASIALAFLMWLWRVPSVDVALALLRPAHREAEPNTSFMLQLVDVTLADLDKCAPANADEIRSRILLRIR